MADLTTEEIAELRRLLKEREKVGPWYGNLRPFDFDEWGPSTAALLAATGNALPALLDMAERCAKAEAHLSDIQGMFMFSSRPAATEVAELLARCATAEAELAKLTCKCSLRTKLLGDGCGICNPEENA